MFNQSRFKITNFTLFETARYDDQYLRPYQPNMDGFVGQQLLDSTEGGQNITPMAVANVANSFLRPSAQVADAVNIEGGFGEKRFMFFLEVVEEAGSIRSSRTRYVLTGYTSHLGVTQDRTSLDPHMRLHFNNALTLRDIETPTATGVETITNVSDNKHILHGSGMNNNYPSTPDQRYMMRPQDLTRYMDAEVNVSGLMNEGAGLMDREVHNAVSMLQGPSVCSRKYESRPMYLHKTIESYQYANAQNEVVEPDDQTNFYRSATGMINTDGSIMTDNAFMKVLMSRSRYMQTGFVELTELAHPDVLPEIFDAAAVVMSGAVQQQREYRPGMGESWGASTNEAIAASIIQSTTPTLMMDCLLGSISLRATNDVIGGEIEVRPMDLKPLTHGLDMTEYLRHFCTRLKYEVLKDISSNNNLVFLLDLEINVHSQISINISIDHQEMVFFSAPLFCDGLFTPLLTSSLGDVDTMANDVDSLMHNLTQGAQQIASHSQQSFNPQGGGPVNIDHNNFSL